MRIVAALKRCRDCGEEKSLDDFYRHPECRDGYRAECRKCYLTKHKAAVNRYQRDPKNWPMLRVRVRRYYHKHAAKIGERHRRNRDALRKELLVAYGGRCACCGEREPAFLTIDHTNRDGAEHRRRVGGSSRIWRDLQKRGWPKNGYALLCMNCNWSTRYGAVCPHVSKR